MSYTILTYVCLAGLAVCGPLALMMMLHAKGIHPFDEVMTRFRRQSPFAKVLLILFVAKFVAYGSNKVSQVMMRLLPRPSGFTQTEVATGYALWNVGTNETWSFAAESAVTNATTVAAWRLRGAAEDWTRAGVRTMLSDGRILSGGFSISATGLSMGLVPEANGALVGGTNATSAAWHGFSATESQVFAWQRALLNRDTNTPVSVKAIVTRDGDVEIHYDLSRAGASAGRAALRTDSGEIGVDLTSNVTSVAFYRLRPEDLTSMDRDLDGVPNHQEVSEYHSDPGLVDTDGDGIPDGEEVANGTDPTARDVPDVQILARVAASATNAAFQSARSVVTNSLVGWKLWDGFAADMPAGATNLVYERTVRVDRTSTWQQFCLSSDPEAAGDWTLEGMTLEWSASNGSAGTVRLSPRGDSLPLALGAGEVSTITFRLRADAGSVRCAKPMHLLAYVPKVNFIGAREVDVQGRAVADVYLEGSQSEIHVDFDLDSCPCHAGFPPGSLLLEGFADLGARTAGRATFEGGVTGGVIRVSRPDVYEFPDISVKPPVPRMLFGAKGGGVKDGTRYLVVLNPSVWYGIDSCRGTVSLPYDWQRWEYARTYRYPLNSKCLWKEWSVTARGEVLCNCSPGCSSGVDLEYQWLVSANCVTNDDVACGTVSVGGINVWSDTAHHTRLEDCTVVASGAELLTELEDCETCEDTCTGGKCIYEEGPAMNSLDFRIPVGLPRKGQISGFAYFRCEGPVTVTPEIFQFLFRGDAQASVTTNGMTRCVVCADSHGFDILIEPMASGVRATVRDHATQALEDVWEIFNVGGPSSVRFRKLSRLDNVMEDKTFVCDGGEWTATDNISGVCETLRREDGLNDPDDGVFREWRSSYDADGYEVRGTYVESRRFGECDGAVLRQTHCEVRTGWSTVWRDADYWDDQAHRARHGALRLLVGDDVGWEYHDWDADGRETLRVEQRNGSDAPEEFPTFVSNRLAGVEGLADAYLTTYDYASLPGDAGSGEEWARARCETRYVVRSGAPTVIGRTWRRYTHVVAGGCPAVKEETWRAASASARFGDAGNAYSYRCTLSQTARDVPLVLRDATVEELDEDGVLTTGVVTEGDGVVTQTFRKSYAGREYPTYEVRAYDALYGNEIRRATLRTDGDVVLDEEVSSYDEKNRLRSTRFADGTSLTNAYSCCRLLWSRDREGRTTLRSGVTGRDHLYYAEEEAWLAALGTNGHKVTQHFVDGFGRETNTVVYVATTPGEATDESASDGRRLTQRETWYPYGGDEVSCTVDERGHCSSFMRTELADRQVTETDDDVLTVVTQVRNGSRTTEKSWDGKWTREIEWEDYDADGCAVRYEATESSDYGTVTNRVTVSDFLGRTIREVTPNGMTETTYHGATERTDTTTLTAGEVTRVTTAVYNERGEEVGSVQDGVTSRTDEAYEMDSDGNWWKVTRSERSDGETVDSSSERREQMTGRESGVISRRIDVDADGVAEETVERRSAAEGERVTSVSNAVTGVRTQTRRYGVVVETATPDETRQMAVDAFGRQVGGMRYVDGADGVRALPCEALEYNATGDVVARHAYTNETDFVTETYEYDTHGRRVASIDALGNETMTRYDAVGNVIEQSGAIWPVRYGYDTAGRRVSLSTTKDGRIWDVTSWTYDPATGKCTAKRYPDGSQVAYAYTPDGLPEVTTKPSQAWSYNVYDEKRQLVEMFLSDETEDARFAYDDFGRMTSATGVRASYSYARHRGGIVTNETVQMDGDAWALTRMVDGFGRLAGRGVSASDLQAIAYDGQGRVAAVSSTAAVATYAYGAGGVDAGYALALNGGATIERRVVRDAYRPERIVAVSNFVNGAAVGGVAYTRDAKGRIVAREDGRRETRDTFGYDAVGQVVCETIEQSEQSEQSNNYSYDLIGNIAGSAALAYTVDGEVTGVGGLTFGYDAASRLTTVATGGVTIATYGYDAFDRRVRKTTPEATTTYLYDGWNLVREEIAGTNGTTDVIEYYWGKDISGSLDTAGGIGGLLYLKRNGAVYVPLYDASGNVVAYVDALGNVVAEFAYDAFGNTVAENGTLAGVFRFKYSTKYHDAETGLIYYGYRYYAPTTARWLTRDPLEEQGGLNLHCFCENDGVNKVDWLGKVPEPTQNVDVRRFWHKVAGMLSDMGCPFTALFIVKSLESGTNHGKTWDFMPSSDLSKEIKNSPEYKDVFDKTIRNLSIGRHIVENEPTSFPDTALSYERKHDLRFFANNSTVRFTRGVVSKQGFGVKDKLCGDKNFVNVTVFKTYKYDEECLSVLKTEKKAEIISGCRNYVGALNSVDWSAFIEERW